MPLVASVSTSRPNTAWIAGIGVLLFALILGGLTRWITQQRLNAALQAAAIRGDTRAIERLAARGADVNWTEATPPLIWAALELHPEAVRALLQHGARVNIRNPRDGETALSMVVARAQMQPVGAEATARVLLEHGADVTLASRTPGSPLSWAKQVDATLKRNPQFYAMANSIYLPENLPPGVEVGRIPTATMEASRRKLVRSILAASQPTK